MNYQVCIPLCGTGNRFRLAGYTTHKSCLDIHGRSMLSRVIEKFPGKPKFYIVTTAEIKDEIESCHSDIGYDLEYIIVNAHKHGPAYSLYLSLALLPGNISTFIVYCDISWEWDADTFNEMVGAGASIACHQGFHPHIVGNNFSAFCKAKEANESEVDASHRLLLEEIREKTSFTDNWSEELLSIGLFQVSDIRKLSQPINSMLSKVETVAGEYFPSLIFNYLCASDDVYLCLVSGFVHYGTPDSYRDFIQKADQLYRLTSASNSSEIRKCPYSSVIYASGNGTRMQGLANVPKALMPVGCQSMIEAVVVGLSLDESNAKIVVNSEQNFISPFNRQAEIIVIEPTSCQLDSLYSSRDVFNGMNSFMLCSCDCFASIDYSHLKMLIGGPKDFQAILFGTKPSLLQKQVGYKGMSSIEFEDAQITHVRVKSFEDVDNSAGLCGFFWVADGNFFKRRLIKTYQSQCHAGTERIVDHIFAQMAEDNIPMGYINVDDYIHLGTQEEYKEMLYWSKSFAGLLSSYDHK